MQRKSQTLKRLADQIGVTAVFTEPPSHWAEAAHADLQPFWLADSEI
jgi:hypothetical protein